MFAELDFDAEADNSSSAPGGVSECACSSIQDSGSSSALTPNDDALVVQLHRPGSEGFSCVAGPADGATRMYDEKLINGDSWVSDECHCVYCEVLKASSSLSKLQGRFKRDLRPTGDRVGGRKTVVLLLDLDNYGFNQFKSVPPRRSEGSNINVLDHLFVWSFFSSCFARYHGVLPDAHVVCQRNSGSEADARHSDVNNLNWGQGKKSVWKHLADEGRLHFTPCGGQQQAADGVIMQIAYAMVHMPLIVVSGDQGLLRAISERRRVAGRKTSRDIMENELTSQLEVINVCKHNKKFFPVWRDLETAVRRIIHHK
ncbi:uncharacterized protein TEOVI_000858600 [Trypanosoma equiperdum]|uniref:Uncharacterized protein n=2 Tax=Trypanozoon TaxID=39700 RepID=Q381V4_TRYB2|nr:hypothetical protein, conserved [Trypanosoma brucei brucei TREU927]EAN80427.1 hypothetical protein, conserved [Trypanosoma brucei brucei TREU927]SCU67786.1 hypothetical protein, conserved [Trypanosoma equiperdum]